MENGVSLDLAQLGSGIYSAKQSKKAAESNRTAQIMWEWIRANNAHQWEVEDLKKAGLNPILSAGGSGALTGGINPSMPDTSGYTGIGTGLTAAKQAKIAEKAQKKDSELKDAGHSLILSRLGRVPNGNKR